MNPKNKKVRIGFAIGAFLCLALFNLSQVPHTKGTQQSAFENWLGELDPKLENPALTGTPLPPLSVRFDAPAHSVHLSLAIGPESDKEASIRFARILQMAREANLFSLPVKEPGEVRFSVESEKAKFATTFNVNDIEQNTQAQAMLKLLEIYSLPGQGAAHDDSK